MFPPLYCLEMTAQASLYSNFTIIYQASDVVVAMKGINLFLMAVSKKKFLAKPRSLLDVMHWLVGIQECLECCSILLPSCSKPLMWWWSYEWPQLITWQPFFTRRCAQISVWDQMNLSRNGNIYASRNRYKRRSYDSPTYLPTYLFWCVGGAMNCVTISLLCLVWYGKS